MRALITIVALLFSVGNVPRIGRPGASITLSLFRMSFAPSSAGARFASLLTPLR